MAYEPAALRRVRPRAGDDPGAGTYRAGFATDSALPPGEEIIYVLEGPLEYQIDGRPTNVYNAGEVLTVPAEVYPRGAQRRHR